MATRREWFGAVSYDHRRRSLAFLKRRDHPGVLATPLPDLVAMGLSAPVCLTWELTYACNLQCVHCLSSSGRRDPRELTTEQCFALIDELAALGVFYVNVGGGEPTLRPDFWAIIEYAVTRRVGVKFSTNGIRITSERARWLAGSDYIDVQVSLDGATRESNDRIRGPGSFDTAMTALRRLHEAGFVDPKLSVVCTRDTVGELDALAELAARVGAILRLTRLRPVGRGADVWDRLHLQPEQQHDLYTWLREHGDGVLTGDSFFHLGGFGAPLPGLSGCGAGRAVCLVDPVGDVYACPFTMHEQFRAGNVTADGGLGQLWRTATAFAQLRNDRKLPQSEESSDVCRGCAAYQYCRGGCPAAKFATGLPPEAPDPECVRGHGEPWLARSVRRPSDVPDHSRRLPLIVRGHQPSACAQSPLAGLTVAE